MNSACRRRVWCAETTIVLCRAGERRASKETGIPDGTTSFSSEQRRSPGSSCRGNWAAQPRARRNYEPHSRPDWRRPPHSHPNRGARSPGVGRGIDVRFLMISAPGRALAPRPRRIVDLDHSKTPCPGGAASALTRLGWSSLSQACIEAAADLSTRSDRTRRDDCVREGGLLQAARRTSGCLALTSRTAMRGCAWTTDFCAGMLIMPPRGEWPGE